MQVCMHNQGRAFVLSSAEGSLQLSLKLLSRARSGLSLDGAPPGNPTGQGALGEISQKKTMANYLSAAALKSVFLHARRPPRYPPPDSTSPDLEFTGCLDGRAVKQIQKSKHGQSLLSKAILLACLCATQGYQKIQQMGIAASG